MRTRVLANEILRFVDRRKRVSNAFPFVDIVAVVIEAHDKELVHETSPSW